MAFKYYQIFCSSAFVCIAYCCHLTLSKCICLNILSQLSDRSKKCLFGKKNLALNIYEYKRNMVNITFQGEMEIELCKAIFLGVKGMTILNVQRKRPFKVCITNSKHKRWVVWKISPSRVEWKLNLRKRSNCQEKAKWTTIVFK